MHVYNSIEKINTRIYDVFALAEGKVYADGARRAVKRCRGCRVFMIDHQDFTPCRRVVFHHIFVMFARCTYSIMMDTRHTIDDEKKKKKKWYAVSNIFDIGTKCFR